MYNVCMYTCIMKKSEKFLQYSVYNIKNNIKYIISVLEAFKIFLIYFSICDHLGTNCSRRLSIWPYSPGVKIFVNKNNILNSKLS